jgi:hypothetical protein
MKSNEHTKNNDVKQKKYANERSAAEGAPAVREIPLMRSEVLLSQSEVSLARSEVPPTVE